jgi:hypothetical protein
MHSATSSMAAVARTYASQVPLPARAQTSGIVAAGVVVGKLIEPTFPSETESRVANHSPLFGNSLGLFASCSADSSLITGVGLY